MATKKRKAERARTPEPARNTYVAPWIPLHQRAPEPETVSDVLRREISNFDQAFDVDGMPDAVGLFGLREQWRALSSLLQDALSTNERAQVKLAELEVKAEESEKTLSELEAEIDELKEKLDERDGEVADLVSDANELARDVLGHEDAVSESLPLFNFRRTLERLHEAVTH